MAANFLFNGTVLRIPGFYGIPSASSILNTKIMEWLLENDPTAIIPFASIQGLIYILDKLDLLETSDELPI